VSFLKKENFMKKKLIYSSVLTALLSASSIALAGGPEIIPEPDYFSGFYVGGIGGVHHNTFNGSSTVTLSQPIAILNIVPLTLVQAGTLNTTDLSGGDFNGYGGIQGGFGKEINHLYYIGLQGWGDWGSTSTTETQTATVPFNSPIVRTFTPDGVTVTTTTSRSASASSSTTMKISNDYGLAGKLGWIIAPRSMLYGKIGASWANIEVDNSLNVNATHGRSVQVVTTDGGVPIFSRSRTDVFNLGANSSNTDDGKVGLLLGAGFEQFVWEDIVSINVEYDYINYGSVSTGPANLSGTDTVTRSATTPGGTFGPTTTTNGVTSNVYSSATTNAKTSELMAGINFYFGRDWF
jgi:hypothetical protein